MNPPANARLNAKGKVVGVAELEADTVSYMFELMSQYFAAVDRDQFETDLADKDDVVLVHAGGELIGFSTMQLREEHIDGRTIHVLFSGDTIMDQRYWNTHEMQRGFVQRATRAMQESDVPLYWLLIAGGYRTYRYLPIFFRDFWPRHDRPTPKASQVLIDTLGRSRFGHKYQNGVVVDGNGYLRREVSPIGERQLQNPHVAYFQHANPGHVHGDELVCLARFEQDNLTRAMVRLQNGSQQG